jgi:hypothetical protein
VFIHCNEGLTVRTVVVLNSCDAFLIKKYQLLADTTIERISKLRAGTSLNQELSQQSRLWQKIRYRLDGSDREYRTLVLKNLKFQMQSLVNNQFGINSYNNAFESYCQKLLAEKNSNSLNERKAYLCFECDNKIFTEINIFENEWKTKYLVSFMFCI